MKNKFLIGELAALFHISTDTLRYYDRIGLIRPDIKGKNGYRYYSMRSFLKLSRILFFRDLDIPLDEIKLYMHNKNTEKLVNLLNQKQTDLDLKIQSSLNLKRKIQQKLDLINSAKTSPDDIQIKSLPRRLALYLETEDAREDIDIDVKSTLKRYGHLLKLSSWITEGQIYTSVSMAHLSQRQFKSFKYIFEIPGYDNDMPDLLATLESSDYACLLFTGAYTNIGTHYNRLLDWIDAHHYEVAGDSVEKNIVDYDFSDRDEEFISELQIPIRPKGHSTTP